MPVISSFLGIVIKMYFSDHNPPHFHAFYDDYEAVFLIDTLEITKGKVPARVAAWLLSGRSYTKKN